MHTIIREIAYVISCGRSVGRIKENARREASFLTTKNSGTKAAETIIGISWSANKNVWFVTPPVLSATL